MSALEPPAPNVAEREPAAFLETLRDVYGRAERTAGRVERWYRIAGFRVRLRFAGPALVSLIAPALDHLAIGPASRPALTVCLWDVESTRPQVPAPPWRMHGDINSPQSRAYGDDRFHVAFDLGTGVLSAMDAAQGVALYCVRDARALPGYETGAPLKPILHWAMRGSGRQLVHAAAVGRPDGGVLLAGRGGAGKSTTALLCLGTELRYAADDYCMLSADPLPYVHSLYNSAKLYPADLERFPRLAGIPSRSDDLDTDKALMFLYPHRREWLTTGFPIRAILVPQVTGHPDTSVSRIPPPLALRALAPSTMFHVTGPEVPTLGILAGYVRRVPCYALRLGTTLSAIPSAILDVLARAPDQA